MMRRTFAALVCLTLAASVATAQTQPTTAPADRDVELERLRSENAALRKALEEWAAAAAKQAFGNLQAKYTALKLERDRAVEQLAVAQLQIAELQREVEALKKRAADTGR